MMDDLKLITLVEHHPILYDNSKTGFKNKNKQNDEWDSIARCMDEDVEEVKSRWIGLRQRFSRERRKITSGAESTNEWELYKYLQFLDRVVKNRRCFRSMSNPRPKEPKIVKVESKEGYSPSSWDNPITYQTTTTEVLQNPKYSEDESLELAVSESSSVADSSRSRTLPQGEQGKMLNTLSNALNSMQNVIDNKNPTSEQDPDVIFGQFVVSQLKLISETEKKEKMKKICCILLDS